MLSKAAIILTLLVAGCTDAGLGAFTTLGDKAEATCYSGGKEVFKAVSTGKVSNSTNSDGYFAKWRDPQGREFYAEISGTCIIKYLEDSK